MLGFAYSVLLGIPDTSCSGAGIQKIIPRAARNFTLRIHAVNSTLRFESRQMAARRQADAAIEQN